MSTELSKQAKPEFIGLIGLIRVLVSSRDIPEWPLGCIGLSTREDPFVIFPEIDWTVNPTHKDRKERISTNELPRLRKHIAESNLILETKIQDPMVSYLFISSLFLDGFSLNKHLNWASYLVSAVGTLLVHPRTFKKLMSANERDPI